MLTLADTDTLRLITLIGVMIGVVFIATVAIMIVRKKILSADKVASSGSMMDDFRRLHASGQLSDAEFQSLKTRMAARLKGETLAPPAPRPAANPSKAPANPPKPPTHPPKGMRSERAPSSAPPSTPPAPPPATAPSAKPPRPKPPTPPGN